MKWFKDPFRRFLILYGALVLLGVVLLFFTRETFRLWAIENSALPLLEAEVSYIEQTWEEEDAYFIRNEIQNEHESIFKYQFREIISAEEYEELERFIEHGDEQHSLEFSFESHESDNPEENYEYIGTETYLPIGDDWQRVEVTIDQNYFESQTGFINWLMYSIIGILIIGFLAASYMIRSIKFRLTDINEASSNIRKKSDLKLRIPDKDLHGPLAVTISELNMMLESLEVSTEKTRQQSNNIAHDLRTPLTSVYQRIQALASEHPELDEIESMVQKLLNTFNLLLRISRLESNGEHIALETVNVAEVVEDVTDLYLPVTEDKRIKLITNVPATHQFRANRELIFQVFCNLLDNSCKFNPDGGEIEIWSEQTVDGVQLHFADQSGGVGEEELNKLCEKFYRSDKSRHTKGNGLGLSLVLAATKKMSGRLTLNDHVLRGKQGLKISLYFPSHSISD
ncbi:sensor histidine kinase [Vibrio sp. HN007]|uniref:sensor histidine kinase n=1 Tax=Vibrio iocasae TaxID=3098914 RepID=UPI0035D51825